MKPRFSSVENVYFEPYYSKKEYKKALKAYIRDKNATSIIKVKKKTIEKVGYEIAIDDIVYNIKKMTFVKDDLYGYWICFALVTM